MLKTATWKSPHWHHFYLKLFHGNKTTPSSPSYFCICIFKGIQCTAKFPSILECWKDLDELFGYKIFPLSSLCNLEKKLKVLHSRH